MQQMPPSGFPRVSVCVPVYNGESFLGDALDSLLAQTCRDYELIICDNASTDSTADICAGYAARDPRIRYFRNETNMGANPNFNRLARMANAPYFKLANADDLCHPDLLARCVEILDRQPDVILCYARTRLIDAKGDSLGDYDDRLDLRCPNAASRFRAVMERIGLVNVLQGVIRTDALKATSLLGSYPGADIVLVGELALRGKFYEVPERLFFRRMHAIAASSKKTPVEQQAFVDPAVRCSVRAWREHLGYVGTLVRTPLFLRDRLTLSFWIARSVIWHRQSLGRELLQLARSFPGKASRP